MYNSVNQLKKIALIQVLVEKHYEEGFTTYAGVFRKHIQVIYPMTYPTFIKYINTPIPVDIMNEARESQNL